jgi:hypothetical protein
MIDNSHLIDVIIIIFTSLAIVASSMICRGKSFGASIDYQFESQHILFLDEVHLNSSDPKCPSYLSRPRLIEASVEMSIYFS